MYKRQTSRQEEVIKAINGRFDTTFNTLFPEMEQIAADMDRAYARKAAGPEQKNPNLPGPLKEAAKARFRSQVAAHRLAQTACNFYSRLVAAAV